jgi:hypothetical protein
MSEGDDAGRPFRMPLEFDRLIGDSQAWLAERGETIVGSGQFAAGRLSGSVHCHFGPADQDKTANQDFALAWLPRAVPNRKALRLVVAIADGLTTSFRSEHASALACWIAVRALVEAGTAVEPMTMARYAFNEAGLSIGRMADEWAQDPEESCPEGQFPSTWKYILAKGALLQTTLTLAWWDRHHLRVGAIGDGGILCRHYHETAAGRQSANHVLAACDLENQQVRALGPADRCITEFDCWRDIELREPFLCALYTDGIGRGLGPNSLALLDALEGLHASGVDDPARRVIEQAVAERPKAFADNLTLAVIRAE